MKQAHWKFCIAVAASALGPVLWLAAPNASATIQPAARVNVAVNRLPQLPSFTLPLFSHPRQMLRPATQRSAPTTSHAKAVVPTHGLSRIQLPQGTEPVPNVTGSHTPKSWNGYAYGFAIPFRNMAHFYEQPQLPAAGAVNHLPPQIVYMMNQPSQFSGASVFSGSKPGEATRLQARSTIKPALANPDAIEVAPLSPGAGLYSNSRGAPGAGGSAQATTSTSARAL